MESINKSVKSLTFFVCESLHLSPFSYIYIYSVGMVHFSLMYKCSSDPTVPRTRI